MCFMEKNDLFITGVHVEETDRKMILKLMLACDKQGYNDYFTIEPAPGKDANSVAPITIPFKEIEDITYEGNFKNQPCTITFKFGAVSERKLIVDNSCFSFYAMREMIRAWKKDRKSRKALG